MVAPYPISDAAFNARHTHRFFALCIHIIMQKYFKKRNVVAAYCGGGHKAARIVMYALNILLISAGIVLGVAVAMFENPQALIAYISAFNASGFQMGIEDFYIPLLLDIFTVGIMCLSAVWTPAFIPSEFVICMRGFIIGFYTEGLRLSFGFKGILIALFGMALWQLPLLTAICIINARVFDELLLRFKLTAEGQGDQASGIRLLRRLGPLTAVAFICDGILVPMTLKLLVNAA